MIETNYEHYLENVRCFFKRAFIKNKELIIEPSNNIYFRLDNVSSDEEFNCKMIEYLSRPSCKGVSIWWQNRIRKNLNRYLNTDFTVDEMELIYTYVGGGVKRKLCKKFLESGWNIETIKEYQRMKNDR